MSDSLYIAVDLGAGSGRVFLGGLYENEFLLEECHRFQYPPRRENGHLRWDLASILMEIENGLKSAGDRARKLNRKIASLGVDSWAVDYGLIDADGKLLANPVCYRDARTEGVPERFFEIVSRRQIFEKTGIQFLNFNTVFQLYADDGSLKKAGKILLLPDLINFFLTGKCAAEYTNATTTQMLNAETKFWDEELVSVLGIDRALLPEIVPAGTDLGVLKQDIADRLNFHEIRVVAPATHDTASAVAGAPLEKNEAFISSGTWSLVGVERDEPLIDSRVAAHNFTNEGGVFGTIRFLKNVMGLWIFESCRREWRSRGIETDYDALLAGVSELVEHAGFIFPDEERFLNPPSMLGAIAAQMAETGQAFVDDPVIMTKIILDSLAFRYASVLRTIEELTGRKIDSVQIVGGGGRNHYLNRMTAEASGKTVRAGLIEATVTGNILVQAIAGGRFADLKEARRYVKSKTEFSEFLPGGSEQTKIAEARYLEIESKYLGAERA